MGREGRGWEKKGGRLRCRKGWEEGGAKRWGLGEGGARSEGAWGEAEPEEGGGAKSWACRIENHWEKVRGGARRREGRSP